MTPTAICLRLLGRLRLRENDYRFYVKNYFDAAAGTNVPYSYKNKSGDGIDWTIWPTASRNSVTSSTVTSGWFRRPRPTFVAGRKYALNWIEVYGDWIAKIPSRNRAPMCQFMELASAGRQPA